MNGIFQGIFWVICGYDACDEGMLPDLENVELLSFRVPCDADGEVLDHDVALNSKSGKSFNHRMQWDSLRDKITGEHSYRYYPRGRVEIRRQRATIFLNPILNEQTVIDQIKMSFGLGHPKIKSIRIQCDGSEHYHCWLDDSAIR